MNKKFSIIIPTMWKSDSLLTMLPLYDSSEFIKEIILIDNEPESAKYDLTTLKKLVCYSEGKNLFVNPSWNIGAQTAKYEIILANDDIIIKNIDRILSLISRSDYEIIGTLLKEKDGDIRIEKSGVFPANSYGCFMYVKNYKHIPDEFKIWYGDRFLFRHNNKRGRLVNGGITSNVSSTVNSDPSFRNVIGKQDRINFLNIKKENRF